MKVITSQTVSLSDQIGQKQTHITILMFVIAINRCKQRESNEMEWAHKKFQFQIQKQNKKIGRKK